MEVLSIQALKKRVRKNFLFKFLDKFDYKFFFIRDTFIRNSRLKNFEKRNP